MYKKCHKTNNEPVKDYINAKVPSSVWCWKKVISERIDRISKGTSLKGCITSLSVCVYV